MKLSNVGPRPRVSSGVKNVSELFFATIRPRNRPRRTRPGEKIVLNPFLFDQSDGGAAGAVARSGSLPAPAAGPIDSAPNGSDYALELAVVKPSHHVM